MNRRYAPCARRILAATLLVATLLAPAATALANDWYPNEYYLHGHTNLDDPCGRQGPCMRSTAYSYTSDRYVWIGVYAEIADYCPGGGWSPTYSAGWNWFYDLNYAYVQARTWGQPARSCIGHEYNSTGGHNIHTSAGASWPVDFYGWSSGYP